MNRLLSASLLVASLALFTCDATTAQQLPTANAQAPGQITMPVPPADRSGWYTQDEFDKAVHAAKMLGMPIAVVYQSCDSNCPLHNAQRDEWMQASELAGFIRVSVDQGVARTPVMVNQFRLAAGEKRGNFIPQLYLGSPEGDYYDVVPNDAPDQQFLASVGGSLKQHGPFPAPKVTLDLWSKLVEGRKFWEQGDQEKAIRLFQPIALAAEGYPKLPVMAEFAKDKEAVGSYLDEKIDAAIAVAKGGDLTSARRDLSKFIRAYRGFPHADKARDLVKDLPQLAAARTERTSIADAPSAERTWTDASGTFELEAEIVAEKQGWIQLRQTDGELIAIEVSRLSEADQAFVKEWTARK